MQIDPNSSEKKTSAQIVICGAPQRIALRLQQKQDIGLFAPDFPISRCVYTCVDSRGTGWLRVKSSCRDFLVGPSSFPAPIMAVLADAFILPPAAPLCSPEKTNRRIL